MGLGAGPGCLCDYQCAGKWEALGKGSFASRGCDKPVICKGLLSQEIPGNGVLQAAGMACAKALGPHWAWRLGQTARWPMWLEQSGRLGKREGAGQGRAGHAGPGDLKENSSFDPKEVGAPGVCPREGMRLLYGNLEGQAERTARRLRPGG